MGKGHSHDNENSHLIETSKSNRKGELDIIAERKQLEARKAATRLKKATVFVLIFFVVEIIGGLMAGSLAILTDAAHLLTDVSSFILAIIANEIASRPACEKLTYGPVRAEVLSALASTLLILVLSGVLVYEAVVRIILISKGEGEDIDGKIMTIVALLGLLVNIILLFILGDHESVGGFGGHDHSHGHGHANHSEGHKEDYKSLTDGKDHGHDHKHSHKHDHDSGSNHDHHHGHGSDDHSSSSSDIEAAEEHDHKQEEKESHKERNINLEAATLHAITDLVQSAGVLFAGLLIWWKPSWRIADPIVTLIFVVLVMNYTRSMLSHALNVLLEGVPEAISYSGLKQDLLDIDGVSDVHCLHIWSLTLGRIVVTAHLKADDPDSALESAHKLLEKMGVVHSTIQIQRDNCIKESCEHPCVSKASDCCE